MTAVPIEKRNVGMVFQSYALFPNMTVADNIGYGLKIRGVAKHERASHAVAIRPRIPLLDEPLTALDAALRDRLCGELNRLLPDGP